MITGTKDSPKVSDPIIRIEAKAKTRREEEILVAVELLGVHSPQVSPNAVPNAEVLEAWEFAAELALTGYQRYRVLYTDYQVAQARAKRLDLKEGETAQVDTEVKDGGPDFSKN